MSTAAPNILTAQQTNVPDILKYQNDCLRTKKFVHLGGVQRIVLEDTADSGRAAEAITSTMGRVLEFFDNWLPIGQVEAPGFNSFLLSEAPVKKKDGHVGLPDIPDPGWVPTSGSKLEMIDDPRNPGKQIWSGKSTFEKPPMIAQPLRQNARGKLAGTNFIVFEAVSQILIKPEGLNEMWLLHCGKNPVDDTHMVFLVDETTGESHFYGGRYVISRPGVF